MVDNDFLMGFGAGKSAGSGGGGSDIDPYDSTPEALGTASAGSSDDYARGDHVHQMPGASDVGAIAAPSSPSSGDVLVYNGSAWAADALSASDVGAYALPSGGIPSTDLDSGVQSSLGKADTALQPVTEVTVSSSGAVTQALDAGKIYHFTSNALTSLTITLNAAASGQLAQYHFDFISGSTAPTLTMPVAVTMPDSFAVEASKRYEVDVLNNYGAVVSWATS